MFSFIEKHYYIDQIYEEASRGKQWASLYYSDPLPSTTARATTVADFRMLTDHDSLQAHLQHRRMTCTRSATMVLEVTGTTSPPARCWRTSCLLVGLDSTVRLLDGPTSKSGHWINELKYFTDLLVHFLTRHIEYINYVSIYFYSHNIFYCIM